MSGRVRSFLRKQSTRGRRERANRGEHPYGSVHQQELHCLSHQYTSVRLAVYIRKAGANREQTRTPGKGRSRDDLNQEVIELKCQAQKYLSHGREGETEGMNEMPWGAPTTQKKISEGTTILGDTLPEEEREGVRKRLRST